MIGSPLFTTLYHYISIIDGHKSVSLGVRCFAAPEYDTLTYGNYVNELQFIQLQVVCIADTVIMTVQTHCQSFYLVASAKSCIFRVRRVGEYSLVSNCK